MWKLSHGKKWEQEVLWPGYLDGQIHEVCVHKYPHNGRPRPWAYLRTNYPTIESERHLISVKMESPQKRHENLGPKETVARGPIGGLAPVSRANGTYVSLAEPWNC